MDRKKLIEIVTKNRDKHISEYKQAVEGYKIALQAEIQKLSLAVDQTPADELVATFRGIPLEKPHSYEKQYSRALQILIHSVDDHIELSNYEFEQLVMDEWEWTNRAREINSSYVATNR